MPNSSGFAVTVKLVDLATGPLAKVNKAIGQVESVAKKAAREGGLFEARDALTKMRKEATEVADKFGQIFTPLGGLSAAGSLAGMVSLAERFARTGTEVSNTARLYGVAAKDLQNWRGAMRLAGGDAATATNLIGSVGRQLYRARAGINPDVIRGASEFGLDISKPDLEFILDAADKLKTLSAQQRRQFAQVFGIDESSLALLSQGRGAVERLIKEAERHGYLNDEQLRQAAELHHAYSGLQQSVESMGNAIGAQMGQWLTPMLKGWSDWLDDMRKSPDAMKKVEIGADLLGAALGVSVAGSLARIAWWSNKIWALPLFKFLVSPAGSIAAALGGLTYGGYKGLEKQAGDQGIVANPAAPGLLPPGMEGVPAGPKPAHHGMGALGGWLESTPFGKWLFGPGTKAPATPPPPKSPPAVGSGQQGGFFDRIGRGFNSIFGIPHAAAAPMGVPRTAVTSAVTPEARGLLAAIATRESEGAAHRLGVSPYNVRYTPGGGAAFNDLSQHPRIYEPGPAGPSSAAGRYQFTYQTWKSFAGRLGLTDFSPQSQDRAAWADAQAVYRRAVGKDLLTDLRNHTFDRSAIPAFRQEWSSVRGDLPDLADRLGNAASSRSSPLNRQVAVGDGRYHLAPGTRFNSKGQAYSPQTREDDAAVARSMAAIRAAQRSGKPWYRTDEEPYSPKGAAVEPYTPKSASAGAESDAGDTLHHLEIHIPNAPPGTRARLTKADGPASVSVRTAYAMPELF